MVGFSILESLNNLIKSKIGGTLHEELYIHDVHSIDEKPPHLVASFVAVERDNRTLVPTDLLCVRYASD